MILRPYQQRAVRDIYAQICRRQSRVCLELATGGGKTAIMAELLRYPLRQAVVTHRRILLEQIARTLEQCGIRYGMRASGYKPDPSAQVHLCMVQTELRRAAKHGIAEGIDVLHVDELHVQKGPQYQGVFNRYVDAGASLVGYTATPSDLGGLVESVYRVATVPDLIEQGFLCPPRLFSCGQPDVRLLEKLRRDSVGEFLPADVNKLVKPQIIFGKVLEHLKRLNPDGRPFVLFAHSVKASLWWAQMLTAKGIPTAHIDGDDVWVDGSLYKSDSIKRAAIFERLTNGSLLGVSNRFVLREGWDCPAVGHAILTAPVGRRQTWVQMCGRVLRPYPCREYAVIQDHSGSYLNHPPLDSGEPWDWEAPAGLPEKTRIAEMRNDKEPEPIVCLARDTMVLTHLGEVPIQGVTTRHLVWDGVEFVRHGGAVCRGVRKVLAWDGILATPEHKVLTSGGWERIDRARAGRRRIVEAGVAGVPKRVPDYSSPYGEAPVVWSGDGSCEVFSLRAGIVVDSLSCSYADAAALQTLQPKNTKMVSEAAGHAAPAVYLSDGRFVQELRRPRHRISVPRHCGCGHVDNREFRIARARGVPDDRPYRQRRALRAGKFALGELVYANEEPTNVGAERVAPGIPKEIPSRSIRFPAYVRTSQSVDGRGNSPEVGVAEVWDIVDCGPRHRFTASGKLVANCPKCHAVRYAGASCPVCGFRYGRQARFVIQSDGELKLIEGKAYRPRTPRPKPGDDKVWERLYFAAVKNGNRTASQQYTWYAKENGWRWLARDLPLMPREEYGWHIPLKDVPKSELY